MTAPDPMHVPEGPTRPPVSLRVLAVDDESGVLQVVELALTMAGHSVHCSTTSEQAMLAFDENPNRFDAAILDYNLSDGTGLELAAYLRAKNERMRIVLVSGRPSEELRCAARDLDVHMLPKPFSVESLQAALGD